MTIPYVLKRVQTIWTYSYVRVDTKISVFGGVTTSSAFEYWLWSTLKTFLNSQWYWRYRLSYVYVYSSNLRRKNCSGWWNRFFQPDDHVNNGIDKKVRMDIESTMLSATPDWNDVQKYMALTNSCIVSYTLVWSIHRERNRMLVMDVILFHYYWARKICIWVLVLSFC